MTKPNHIMVAGAAAFALQLPLPFSLAFVFGTLIPDVDLVLGESAHRTITHWWPAWAISLLVCLFFLKDPLNLYLSAVCGGALVHILCDVFTKMGVPLGINPFARRRSLKWMRVNTFKELGLALVLSGILVSIGVGQIWLRAFLERT
jgi:membrane-bound metal-dependent hydrolase YbcI (DUF457 family)